MMKCWMIMKVTMKFANYNYLTLYYMRILSIDPALKNIAITKVLFDDNKSIIDIEPNLINIIGTTKTISYQKMMNNLIVELDKINIDDVDIIIIENQPSLKNMKVKTVSVAIFTYFLIKKKSNIHFVSPNSKPKEIKECQNYNKRKKLSVELCLNLLNDECKDKISHLAKRDDATDSILQAKYYIDKI
jgi:hypothetical protein